MGSGVRGHRAVPASLSHLWIHATTFFFYDQMRTHTHTECYMRAVVLTKSLAFTSNNGVIHTLTCMHIHGPFCWNNRCWDNGTRGQRNEGFIFSSEWIDFRVVGLQESTSPPWALSQMCVSSDHFLLWDWMCKLSSLSVTRLLSRHTQKTINVLYSLGT